MTPSWVVALLGCCVAERWPKDATLRIRDGDTFQYIVVGAGAAGSVVAARLSLRGYSVLLVEAGGDPSLFTRIPGAAQSLLGSAEDWQYETRSNNVSCLSSRRQACRFSRGKCLGGSTSINYMMYVRGHRTDFWPLWARESLLPYMLHYEGLQDLSLLPPSSDEYHNTDGIMKIGFFTDTGNAWFSRIAEAFRHLGFPYNYDVNAGTQIGVSEIIGYTHDGERTSAARAYLRRRDVQANLYVMKNTRVVRVLIVDYEARGVSVVTDTGRMRLYAEREVILSAGTIGTAQILLQSGIGPAKHLREHGVPVLADLPVGRNIKDHVLPLLFIPVDRGFPLDIGMLYNLGLSVVDAAEYLATKEGPLASIGLTQLTAFLNTDCYDYDKSILKHDRAICHLPNLQIIFSYLDKGLLTATAPVASQSLNLDEPTMKQLAAANLLSSLIVVSPVSLQPHSVGHIELSSSDPLAPPLIFPNYLSDERDTRQMVLNIRVAQDLARALNSSLLRLEWPDCAADDYWSCYARHMTYSVFHATGSTSATVDARLRVRGFRHLRVADASVLDRLPRGNTEALVLAVGEMLARYVLQDANDS